jgi:glycosyltransferase involved in cell wall biosynthesis
MTKNRIAFCGTRGLPANYGGFETAVDEISRRFVQYGYSVDVFCRLSHSGEILGEHEGRRLITVKGATIRSLETFVSAFQTGWYLLRNRHEYSHAFWFNNANFPGILLTLLAGVPVTVNTDGLEWRRKKWLLPFKIYYYFTAWLISCITPRLISDSRGIQSFYKKAFQRDSHWIPYGVPKHPKISIQKESEILQFYSLEAGKYFLQITRIEPDNLPLETAKSFHKSGLAKKGYKFVVVGYKEKTPYAERLNKLNNCNGISVLPANYDQQILYTLRNNCFCYVHGNSVGGTNPALLEAMSICPRIIAIDVIFSREILGHAGIYFSLENLDQIFRDSISFPDIGEELRNNVYNNYQWDAVAISYMAILKNTDCTYVPKTKQCFFRSGQI